VDSEAGARRPGTVLIATGLGLFMIFLDALIVNVALPDIQSEFDTGEAGVQWVVAAYSMTMAMFMMSGATLADRLGRRRTYVLGMVVFAVASIGCAASPGIEVLTASRALQGVGAAVVNVASLAVVSAAFTRPSDRARAIGTWTGVASVGLALGPTIGGVLTDEVGWRSIFIINPFVAAVAVVITLGFVSESRDPTRRGFDPLGQLLFILGIGALTFALVEIPEFGWTSPVILACLLGALGVLAVFVTAELRIDGPMMDVRVFRDRVYTTAIVTVFCILFCAYGTLLTTTQYFQNVREYSAVRTGILMLAFALPIVVGAPVSGHLAARIGARPPTLAGLTSMVVGCAVVALTTGGALVYTVIGLFLVGAAGVTIAPATNIAMGSIAPERAGMASGILSAQRGLGSTAGYAIMGSVLAATVAGVLPGKLEPLIPDDGEREAVVADVEDAANPQAVPAVIGPRQPTPSEVAERREVLEATDDAFVDGVRVASAVAFVVALAALILGYVIFPKGRGATESDESEPAKADVAAPT
jgi:EmrB/QacA subfamily drug resistance transporter